MNGLAKTGLRVLAAIAIAAIAGPMVARAQTDEIQVYDGSIAAKGKFNLTWHNNFTPDGIKTPAFDGGLIPDKSYNGVTEWAWGITDWFEGGLYLPLYSFSKDRGGSINGGKIRLLFAEPHAEDQKFIYAVNFEFSYNSKHWDDNRYTSEIRPIIGWHLHPWDIIINPILDNAWKGGFGALDFAPAERLAYNFNPKFALAVEEYADYGQLHAIVGPKDQVHELWGVVDRGTKFADIEAGIGFGLTPASDKVTLKLMFSRDLN
jgi:hypothetical protein